ncbi:TfoX/Sxy family protein [Aquimarina hainanensis]|uniref:TfoX/Sxy family protein n=1 Tax=Aquimarina hainanensis TaxID=1578017 RepID=A0ABW5NC85_9FLAO|nr:TfoX/Sxy family protein [Aquimarina sp. TRL1]QKX07008.1 TfoX/Sxy family protein [Aquimarina sp. TRL1]
MSYNEHLATRIRTALSIFPEEFSEKKMFGGLAFLYKGKMTLGIIKEELAVRVLADKMEKQLSLPFVRPMDFTKRPMKEFVYVAKEGFITEMQLQEWIELGLEHAKSKL